MSIFETVKDLNTPNIEVLKSATRKNYHGDIGNNYITGSDGDDLFKVLVVTIHFMVLLVTTKFMVV